MKILNILFTLFGVITAIFFLFQVLPGDPGRMMMGQNEDDEQLKLINARYGFDKPVMHQYFFYLNDISPISIHSKNNSDFNYLDSNKYSYINFLEVGNSVFVVKYPYFRESYQRRGEKVSNIIANAFPNTAILAITSILFATVFGLVLGIYCALFKDTISDSFIQFISTIGISVPSFLSAIVFAWIFGYVFSDITNLNMTGSLYELSDSGEYYELKLRNLILPSIVLGIRPISIITMLMRNSMIQTLNQNYILTAYSKGLSKYKVIVNHCLKNSLNPVVTALSGWFASLLAGSVFVEYIFGWNGLGREIVNSLNNLDVPVIMGAVTVVSLSFILINIFVDEIYKYLDPRIN